MVNSCNDRNSALTRPPSLSFFSPLQDLLLQLSRPLLVFLVPLIAQLSNALQKVIDVFCPVGVGDRGHLGHVSSGACRHAGRMAAVEEDLQVREDKAWTTDRVSLVSVASRSFYSRNHRREKSLPYVTTAHIKCQGHRSQYCARALSTYSAYWRPYNAG